VLSVTVCVDDFYRLSSFNSHWKRIPIALSVGTTTAVELVTRYKDKYKRKASQVSRAVLLVNKNNIARRRRLLVFPTPTKEDHSENRNYALLQWLVNSDEQYMIKKD